MSLKDTLKKNADNIKETAEKLQESSERLADKVKHTIGEATHHGAAESEYAKRKALGDRMSPQEHAESMANEAKHRVQAEIEGVKKNLDDV